MKEILNYLKQLSIIIDEQVQELDNVINHSSVYLLNGKKESLILKKIKQPWINENKLNKQGRFVELMRGNGAPFSKIIQFDNQDYYLKTNNQLFTLETYVNGIEECEFTKDNCTSLAKLCGKLHRISEGIHFQFGYDGAWSVDFEQNYCDEQICEKEEYFKEMLDCLKDCYYDEVLLNKVTNLFEKKMKELKNDLKSLPKGPSQGDLSLDNVRFNEQHEAIAVFDYNIAGDERYVWEFVNQIAWYQEFIKEDIDLKVLMLSSYESERQLTDEERNIVDKYLEFAKVTRYSKYMEIKYYARQGEREKVETYLNQFLCCEDPLTKT